MVLESVLTCPVCGHAKAEQMPLDACQWFYECAEAAPRCCGPAGGLLRVLLVWHATLPVDAGERRGGCRRVSVAARIRNDLEAQADGGPDAARR